jgi:hypothetical protein
MRSSPFGRCGTTLRVTATAGRLFIYLCRCYIHHDSRDTTATGRRRCKSGDQVQGGTVCGHEGGGQACGQGGGQARGQEGDGCPRPRRWTASLRPVMARPSPYKKQAASPRPRNRHRPLNPSPQSCRIGRRLDPAFPDVDLVCDSDVGSGRHECTTVQALNVGFARDPCTRQLHITVRPRRRSHLADIHGYPNTCECPL